jgi:RNA polymerase sigma-70 factor (ECF subfamily)
LKTVSNPAEHHWCKAIYDAKAAELVLYGRALGLGHGEAEDVLQETFAVLLQMATRPARAEHYCVRTYRNRALNHRRSLWRRLTREWEAFAGGHLWFEPTPDESREEQQAMRALAKLPPEQREVIVLKIWHGCTFEEIGGLLEISPNTAAGRYRYGLQKIKNELNGVAYEKPELERETDAFLASTPGFERA